MENKFVFTIDWEDFSQLLAKYAYGEITAPKFDIDRQTNILLNLLNESNVKATFFILGITAKYKKDLVKKIASDGHEIALHGNNHDSLPSIDYATIKKDIEDSKKIVEDIVAQKVQGYRAPFFSMTKERLFVLEILAEKGFVYDSSIFPSNFGNFGIKNFSDEYCNYKLKNSLSIVELPLKVHKIAGASICLAGGSYMRIAPTFYVKKIYKAQQKNKINAMLYMHPYEFDTQKILIENNYPENHTMNKFKISLKNLRWNINRSSITPKIKLLLSSYEYQTALEQANSVNKSMVLDY